MYRDRTPAHRLVTPSGPVGPWHGKFDLLCEGNMSEFLGEPPDRRGRDPAGLCNRRRGVARIEIALGHKLKDRNGAPTVGQRRIADEAGHNARCSAAGERSGSLENERLALLVAGE